MSMDRLKAAKEMFLKYGGSHYFMDNNGEYELYKSFGISREQEQIWIREHQSNLIRRLRRESDAEISKVLISALVSAMEQDDELSALPVLFDEIRHKLPILDSLSKVIVAEVILNLFRRLVRDGQDDAALNGKSLVATILRDVIANPITVASGYKEREEGQVEYLKGENILARARRDLDKL